MRQQLNITLPTCWQELSDRQLRQVFHLLNGQYTLTQIKTICLLRWAHLRVVRREGAIFIVRYDKRDWPVTVQQIYAATETLQWLGDFPAYPVRLSRIGRHRAKRADFQDVSFGDFLAIDNFYHGYLATQNRDLLREIAVILYKAKQIKLSPEEDLSVFYWVTSIKRFFANMFTAFFRQVNTDEDGFGGGALSYQQLRDNMDTQIRALTGGDITKEKEVLEMDCWRALTELNAKAKDYEDIHSKK